MYQIWCQYISKMTEKSPENLISAKGNNSCKSVAKRELDLFKTNSYTKFQVIISKDDREKSGKLNFSKGQ